MPEPENVNRSVGETDLQLGQLSHRLAGVRLQQLIYLDTVGRVGHFARSAEALSVSQPALSQGLRSLERSVGAPLFERVGRRQRLTATGEETLAFARRVLAEAASFEARLDESLQGRGGRLRLGLIDAAALYLLTDQLQSFRKQHPAVDLRLRVDTSDRLLAQLESYDIDMAIVVGPAPNETATQVATEPLFIYGPPLEHPADAERWVLYPEQSRTRRYIDQALSQMGVAPTVDNESSNPSVIAQLVRLGAGWTILPAGIAESISEPLTRRSEAIAHRPLFAVRRRAGQASALSEALLAQLAIDL